MLNPSAAAERTLVQDANLGYSQIRRKMQGVRVAARRTIDMLIGSSPIQEMSRRHGIRVFFMEGYMDPAQYEWFEKLFAKNAVHKVAQTGFNAGHSAFAFANLGAEAVTSFDINEHTYVRPAHEYLVKRFPKTQFQLVLGDSVETVPLHQDDMQYDIAFIDGGHSEAVAQSDLVAMQRLVKPGGYVVMDDYGGSMAWQVGPTLAYDQAVSSGLITPLSVERSARSGWALGQYTI